MEPVHVDVEALNVEVAKSVQAGCPLSVFELGDAEAGGQGGVVEGGEITR